MPDPSPELVARAQGGDAAAFTALYAHYQAPIWNFLYALFGDADDADEFAQDTFLKAYRGLPRTSADLRVGAWLYRIATNVALDAFRHRSLVTWESLDRAFGAFGGFTLHQKRWDAEGVGGDFSRIRRHGYKLVDHDRRQDPERAAVDAEVAVRVRGVLARLRPRHRACLALREYRELSYDEIADQLQLTRSAVKSLLLRARAEFRQYWWAEELRRAAGAEALGGGPVELDGGVWVGPSGEHDAAGRGGVQRRTQ